jgi:cytochrome P450
MNARLRPPALELPDVATVRWGSFTKIVRQPEENWPVQICSKPIIAKQFGKRAVALIADPEAAKTILTGGADKFPRWRIYQHVVGNGPGRESLSAVDGAQWSKLRKSFTPMFKPEQVSRLMPLVRRATAQTMASWQAQNDPITIDISLEMTRLTLDVIWRVLFGDRDPPPLVDRAATAIHTSALRNDSALQVATLSALAEAAANPAVRTTMLENPFRAWNSKSGSGQADDGLTWQELHDNARGLLGAGHETTALTLTWALWIAAQDTDTQYRIHEEIDRVVGDSEIEEAHLNHLVFTGAVLNETLRLLPPGYVTVRQSKGPVTLSGESLPPGTVLVVCIYALHRHRNWWEEPDLFWPDRFARGKPRHRYAFLPFSAGRHACIAGTMGWMEIITAFASILRHFRLSTDTRAPMKLRTNITLRPDRAVPITLHRRDTTAGR